jgi:cytochrome bd-type quinol oxidase subunit 1
MYRLWPSKRNRHLENIEMLGNPIKAKVIFALALAILMAWAGHTSALVMGSTQPILSASDGTQPEAHDNDAVSVCSACSNHAHSPSTADHVHETPHLPTLLSISTKPERAIVKLDASYWIPARPIFLIERPPRPSFLL